MNNMGSCANETIGKQISDSRQGIKKRLNDFILISNTIIKIGSEFQVEMIGVKNFLFFVRQLCFETLAFHPPLDNRDL